MSRMQATAGVRGGAGQRCHSAPRSSCSPPGTHRRVVDLAGHALGSARPARAAASMALLLLAAACRNAALEPEVRLIEELRVQDAEIRNIDAHPAAGIYLAADRIYRRTEGGSWDEVPGTAGVGWRGLWVRPGDIWASGSGTTILHGDGIAFSKHTIPRPERLIVLTTVQVVGFAGEAWATFAGDGLFHLSGGNWEYVEPPELAGTSKTLLYAADPDYVFLNAQPMVTSSHQHVARRVAGRWQLEELPPGIVGYVSSLRGSGSDDVWAVGLRTKLFGKGGWACHWDGRGWTNTPLPIDMPLMDVAVVSPREAWAVGWRGTLLRWDGSRWSHLRTGLAKHLTGITALPGGPVLVIDHNQRVLRVEPRAAAQIAP